MAILQEMPAAVIQHVYASDFCRQFYQSSQIFKTAYSSHKQTVKMPFPLAHMTSGRQNQAASASCRCSFLRVLSSARRAARSSLAPASSAASLSLCACSASCVQTCEMCSLSCRIACVRAARGVWLGTSTSGMFQYLNPRPADS